MGEINNKLNKKRILAVIPARAGSKGIPNKNIRLLKGKPLICYSIVNAISSELITDIVVTSDSEEIKTICQQMNVTYKARNSNLCGDAITLDSVIYDAMIGYDVDYVITMQPTSPTLKLETLDNAIRYAIENDLDTVISVNNQPHLSWREEEGKKVPNYKQRLNRQYLPANYMETGAFVISKAGIVTEDSRIGEKVDVYELADSEAIDIDSFADFQLAASYLSEDKIAMYVNGNNEIGMGHIFRVLELADEFNVKPDIYYNEKETDISFFGQTTHNLIAVTGNHDFVKKIEKGSYSIIVNDILDTSYEFMSELRENAVCAKITNFEDCGSGSILADYVINALYGEDMQKNHFSGERYYILPKLFLLYQPIKIREIVKKVCICFGGADPQNYTERLLEMICQEKYKHIEFSVILGRAKKNVSELMKYSENKNITVLYDVKNMPSLMSECDIAITSRGRTCYELASLGIPTITIAQNSREEKHEFASAKNGFIYLGLNPDDHVIDSNLEMLSGMDVKGREYYKNLMMQADLRNGRNRVIRIIKGEI